MTEYPKGTSCNTVPALVLVTVPSSVTYGCRPPIARQADDLNVSAENTPRLAARNRAAAMPAVAEVSTIPRVSG
jgi:hypothetical protein